MYQKFFKFYNFIIHIHAVHIIERDQNSRIHTLTRDRKCSKRLRIENNYEQGFLKFSFTIMFNEINGF